MVFISLYYFSANSRIKKPQICRRGACRKKLHHTDEQIKFSAITHVMDAYDLSELEDVSYTALFTYDAMVHFELIDVYQYLQEAYRVLEPGGKALFHHSNLHSDYKISFSNSPYYARNYMSKEIFAYLAYRAGFRILEQQTINWGIEDLDCLTLVQK